MKIFVSVKPNAKQEKIEKKDETHFRLWVKAPPADGKANQAVIESLSCYFNLPKSRFSILAGHQSKNKVIAVLK